MSATFYRRLMSHRSSGGVYILLRSIWQTGLKLKTNSTATKVSSSAIHWNFDNIRITFEGRTNERHPSEDFLISLKSTICTAAQLENHVSLPRGSSSDEYDSESFIRNYVYETFWAEFRRGFVLNHVYETICSVYQEEVPYGTFFLRNLKRIWLCPSSDPF